MAVKHSVTAVKRQASYKVSVALTLTSLIIIGGWWCSGEKKTVPIPETSVATDSMAVESMLDMTIVATDSASVVVPDAMAKADDADIFTDERDGKTYRSARIGKFRWMAENLNYETATTERQDSSWCYENSLDSCAKYGRLYNLDAAVEACPDGWHLPTNENWDGFVRITGDDIAGKNLKSKTGWNNSGNGIDIYAFSALPGGGYFGDGSFKYIGDDGFWWTESYNDPGGYAYGRYMRNDSDSVREYYIDAERLSSYGLSVRCIRE